MSEKEPVLEEVTVEQFEAMKESADKSSIDWDAVWERIDGKIISRKRFEEIVNDVRGTPGATLWWSVFESALKRWKSEGKVIESKYGLVGNRKKKFFRFASK